ncbi:hypothetical protein [Peribacillus sp. NPDC060253]|uniref:hypothetical protein n=1 Tax=Peribacillus sp. NPDC060253 TaxID=3347084 RepID=UPI003666E36A
MYGKSTFFAAPWNMHDTYGRKHRTLRIIFLLISFFAARMIVEELALTTSVSNGKLFIFLFLTSLTDARAAGSLAILDRQKLRFFHLDLCGSVD